MSSMSSQYEISSMQVSIFQVYSGLQKPGAVLSDKETADIEKQLGRIQALYRRQMRVPLMNCEAEALQEEALEYFDDIGAQMKEDLKKTQQRLSEKVLYEDELVSLSALSIGLCCELSKLSWESKLG